MIGPGVIAVFLKQPNAVTVLSKSNEIPRVADNVNPLFGKNSCFELRKMYPVPARDRCTARFD